MQAELTRTEKLYLCDIRDMFTAMLEKDGKQNISKTKRAELYEAYLQKHMQLLYVIIEMFDLKMPDM